MHFSESRLMGGIAGIYAYHYAANTLSGNDLAQLGFGLAVSGTDSPAQWLSADGSICIASDGAPVAGLTGTIIEPMAKPDSQRVAACHGHLAHLPALRARLESRSGTPITPFDAETLLLLHAVGGEREMLEYLSGAFAFAVWNSQDRRLVLGCGQDRDRPLHYTDDGWVFRFASASDALQSVPQSHVRILPAGHSMLIDRLGAHPSMPLSRARPAAGAAMGTG